MSLPLIKIWFARAINTVVAQQPELWELVVGERAVVAQIFHQLDRSAFKTWDIDIEYLREGVEANLKPLCNGKHGVPDLIVHRRGKMGERDNLLIVEFKLKHSIHLENSLDRSKIEYWQTRYGYQFGAVVSLGEHSPQPEWSWRTQSGGEWQPKELVPQSGAGGSDE